MMADGFDDDMTRCPCCDGEGYFYHGDEPKSPWGDAATIARLTAERDQARAEAVAAYERAEEVARNRESHAKGETARACRGIAVSIGMLATEPGTTALAEIVKKAVDAERRRAWVVISEECLKVREGKLMDAILARIDQRKEAA